VLFLDEPTIGLDPIARRLVWNHLKDLSCKYQMTMLITTHDMEEADELCDELAFLHQGIIVVQVNPAELKASIGPDADFNDVFIHFSAIFYGINVILEKDLGVVHKLLVSPAPRSALILGKSVSSGFRGLIQASIIYLMALFMHIGMNNDLLHILGVLLTVILGSAIFSTFSLIIACLVKSRDRFMGIGQVSTMPLFFASSAIYPISMMPDWLKMVARVNPLTYLVDAMRTLMIHGAQSIEGLGTDFVVMILSFIVFSFIATRLYPGLVR
jgi:ABC-2 type transport system permease protein